MKILCTFAVVNESLYSVRYDDEETHEFARLFRLWNDAEYMEEFFHNHRKDLERDFWNRISVDQAILKTRKDAKQLEWKMIQIAKYGKTNYDETLSTFFKPLNDKPTALDPYEKSKSYGLIRPSWLRIYAIRLDTNVFVVSGGAIKLTPNMNEQEHLRKELKKLEMTRNYCKEEFGLDADFVELR